MPDAAAVLARTSVDCARVGALTTYARHPSGRHLTSVALHGSPDGTVEWEMAVEAFAARQLLARPVATLRVAPSWCEPVLLQGAARRLPRTDAGAGVLRFRLHIAVVRVGTPPVVVDGAAYVAAEPDPLRHDAPAILAHLDHGHAGALTACLRAGGHDVRFASATRLDRTGLTAVAVRDDGVDTVHLGFPEPVASLAELPLSLGCVLRPTCGCCWVQQRRPLPGTPPTETGGPTD